MHQRFEARTGSTSVTSALQYLTTRLRLTRLLLGRIGPDKQRFSYACEDSLLVTERTVHLR